MIQENEDRLNILNYRLEQSNNVIEEIAFHIERGFYVTAVNRIYYAMFYALSALALLYKFETSKHLQLIGWFNKTFIKVNLIEYKHGEALRKIYEKRQKGDYEPFVNFTKTEVEQMYSNMKEFIFTIELYINANKDKLLIE